MLVFKRKVKKLRNRSKETFIRYKPLAYKIASQISKKYGRNYNEFAEEAISYLAWTVCNGLMPNAPDQSRAGQNFDAKQARLATWLYTEIYWHLVCYATKRQTRREAPLDAASGLAAGQGRIDRLWSEVGEEGRALLVILFEAPGALGKLLWRTQSFTTKGKDGEKVRDLREIPKIPTAEERRMILRENFIALLQETWPEDRLARAMDQVESCLES